MTASMNKTNQYTEFKDIWPNTSALIIETPEILGDPNKIVLFGKGIFFSHFYFFGLPDFRQSLSLVVKTLRY